MNEQPGTMKMEVLHGTKEGGRAIYNSWPIQLREREEMALMG
jgi:hypothetical protein